MDISIEESKTKLILKHYFSNKRIKWIIILLSTITILSFTTSSELQLLFDRLPNPEVSDTGFYLVIISFILISWIIHLIELLRSNIGLKLSLLSSFIFIVIEVSIFCLYEMIILDTIGFFQNIIVITPQTTTFDIFLEKLKIVLFILSPLILGEVTLSSLQIHKLEEKVKILQSKVKKLEKQTEKDKVKFEEYMLKKKELDEEFEDKIDELREL